VLPAQPGRLSLRPGIHHAHRLAKQRGERDRVSNDRAAA
jgi:hypothetical protein